MDYETQDKDLTTQQLLGRRIHETLVSVGENPQYNLSSADALRFAEALAWITSPNQPHGGD